MIQMDLIDSWLLSNSTFLHAKHVYFSLVDKCLLRMTQVKKVLKCTYQMTHFISIDNIKLAVANLHFAAVKPLHFEMF